MKNNNLIQARKDKGMTQEQLADALGKRGKQSVSNWENGYTRPPLHIAFEIAQILEVDPAFLFGDKVQDTHTKEKIVSGC